MKSIRTLSAKVESPATEVIFIAQVSAIENNQVVEIECAGQVIVVDECVTGYMAFQQGDRVVAQRIGQLIVVTQRLANPDEPNPPALSFNGEQWCLQSKEAFALKVGRAELTVGPNGDVSISGSDILTDASGVNRILGARIELN